MAIIIGPVPFRVSFYYATTCSSRWRMACYSVHKPNKSQRASTNPEPRLIDLLVFFAQHSGEVLSRDELIDNVWKRSIVTNHVVTQSISELRKSLKDNDEDSPVYIATVPKRGYKLMVPVIWCSEEEGEEMMLSSSPPIPEATPDTDPPSTVQISNTPKAT